MAEQKITGYHLNFNTASDNHTRPLRNEIPCLIYIRRGGGSLQIGDEVISLTEGQSFFQPPHTPLCYWSDEKGWEYIWLLFDGPMFREMLPKTGFKDRPTVVTCTEEQQKLWADILSNRFDYRGSKYYETLSMLIHLLSTFIESFPSDTQMLEDTSTRSILTFIENNLHRTDLNVKLLMQVTGLGRTALYDKFRRKGQAAPSAYIRNMRITKAKHLLRSTELPIGQVAFAVGLEDPLYFSRIFRAFVGNSPSGYRNYFRSNRK